MKNEHEEKWEGGKIMLKGFYKNFMANWWSKNDFMPDITYKICKKINIQFILER
jgi:hypothetical protein